jgi:hypothetical protein
MTPNDMVRFRKIQSFFKRFFDEMGTTDLQNPSPLLMDWKDMNLVQRFEFLTLMMTLCAPLLGVLLAIVGCAIYR